MYAHDQDLAFQPPGEVQWSVQLAYHESRWHSAWSGDGEEQAVAKPGLVFVLPGPLYH